MEKIKTVSLGSLTAIQLGGAFCLPVIMAGQLLVQRYGLFKALMALGLGNIVLYFLASGIGTLSVSYRLSTLSLAQELLGPVGRVIGACALLVPMIGWSAVMNHFVGASLCTIFPGSSFLVMATIAAVMVMGIVWWGVKGVTCVSTLSIPLLFVATGAILYRISCCGAHQHLVSEGALFSAVALVVSIALAAVVDLPTYYRFASSRQSAQLSLMLVFLVGLPLIEGLGLLIGLFLSGKTLVDVFGAHEGGFFSQVITLLLVFKGLATNTANVYSGAVSVTALTPRISLRIATVFIGVLSLLISFLPLLDHLEYVLSAMAVATGSLGALFMDARCGVRFSSSPALVWSALCAGVAVGGLALYGGSFLTGEPLCDSFLVTGIMGYVGSLMVKRRQ